MGGRNPAEAIVGGHLQLNHQKPGLLNGAAKWISSIHSRAQPIRRHVGFIFDQTGCSGRGRLGLHAPVIPFHVSSREAIRNSKVSVDILRMYIYIYIYTHEI